MSFGEQLVKFPNPRPGWPKLNRFATVSIHVKRITLGVLGILALLAIAGGVGYSCEIVMNDPEGDCLQRDDC
jgi:hypothetical protein